MKASEGDLHVLVAVEGAKRTCSQKADCAQNYTYTRAEHEDGNCEKSSIVSLNGFYIRW